MPNLTAAPTFETYDLRLLSADAREDALRAFETTPSGRERPGRYWKIDLESISLDGRTVDPAAATVTIASSSARVTAVDLATAAREHGDLLARAFGRSVDARHKFAHLARAFASVGAFVHVQADTAVDEPIVVTYRAGDGATFFPYTVVLVENGANVAIVERIEAGRDAFVCGVVEIVTGESAQVSYASVQTLPDDARTFFTRTALPGRDATVSIDNAELGAALSVTDIDTGIDREGVDANVGTLFFPTQTQHVDVVSTIDHRTGNATSETIVKSAAAGSGQARYLGNIRIAAHAQGSNASLRDDALLLSKKSHIDSVPALEIAANDVKAYHGATVGALDEDQIFYMTSRGVDRQTAERMIALGFFEPVIERFPTEALRDELRAALAAKVL